MSLQALQAELLHTRNKINDTSRALKLVEWKEKEALECLIDVLLDDEDMILEEMDLIQANQKHHVSI